MDPFLYLRYPRPNRILAHRVLKVEDLGTGMVSTRATGGKGHGCKRRTIAQGLLHTLTKLPKSPAIGLVTAGVSVSRFHKRLLVHRFSDCVCICVSIPQALISAGHWPYEQPLTAYGW